jgi:hypothetical protein
MTIIHLIIIPKFGQGSYRNLKYIVIMADPASEKQQTIGYRTFSNGEECRSYFRHILTSYRRNQDLNEYEHHNLIHLIEKGHPRAAEKLQGGVKSIQVKERKVDGRSSKCFHLIKENGDIEDVSYVKCVESLYPGSGATAAS